MLNRISETVLWTYRCLSLGGYVVDCPHRERLGYGAEGQVAVDTALFGFDQGALYTKWMADWRDVQDPTSGRSAAHGANLRRRRWAGLGRYRRHAALAELFAVRRPAYPGRQLSR